MTKLPENIWFFDFSGYARYPAILLVKALLKTKINSIVYTILFFIAGLTTAALILFNGSYLIAAIMLPIKSLLDAADGEVARRKNQPSYVGRYLDSVCDFIINLLLFFSIGYISNTNFLIIISALVLFQIQGSVYNYYYVIKRHQVDGDKTSRIDESSLPEPYPWDNLTALKILHTFFKFIYGWQDKAAFRLDSKAGKTENLPGWFLTLVSVMGLGFQLLIIAVCIYIGHPEMIFMIFIFPFTLYMLVIVFIRKAFIK